MAILDLLRRRRPDEEDEDADGAEDAVEESEDSDSVGGLLGRLASVPGMGRVLRRGDPGADADDAEEEADGGGQAGGILGRFNLASRIDGILRRGGDDDDDEDEDGPPAVGVAASPEPPAQAVEPASPEAPSEASLVEIRIQESPEVYSKIRPDGTYSADQSPIKGNESEAKSAQDVAVEERPKADQRLRELARSQEDVPAEELAGDLRELLDRINRWRR